MLHTVKAIIDQQGHVQWLEPVELHAPQQVLITLLDEEISKNETAALAEPALAKKWLNEEEDAAWAHLQPEAQYS